MKNPNIITKMAKQKKDKPDKPKTVKGSSKGKGGKKKPPKAWNADGQNPVKIAGFPFFGAHEDDIVL